MTTLWEELPENWLSLAQSKQWKERNEAVNILKERAESAQEIPLEGSDVYVEEIVKLTKDFNLIIAGASIECMYAIITAMKEDFRKYTTKALENLLHRFKDRKQTVIDSTHKTLILLCTYSDFKVVIAVMTKALKATRISKVKIESMVFMEKLLYGQQKQILVNSAKEGVELCLLMMNDADESVREGAMNNVAILSGVIGKSTLDIFTKNLISAKKKRLEEIIEARKGEIQEKRRAGQADQGTATDSSGDAPAAQEGEIAGESESMEEEEKVDPYLILTEEDLLSKLPKGFYKRITHEKWKERMLVLNELLTIVTDMRKFKRDSYEDLFAALKIEILEVNVNNAKIAIDIIGILANGLRRHIRGSARVFVAPLVERLKEKKPAVVESIVSTMTKLLLCFGLKEMIPDIKSVFKRVKLVQIRREVLKFLGSAIKLKNMKADGNLFVEIANLCILSMDDSSEDVRTAAVDVFVALAGVFGNSAVEKHIKSLDAIKSQRISQAISKSVDPLSGSASAPKRSNSTRTEEEREKGKANSEGEATNGRSRGATLGRRTLGRPRGQGLQSGRGKGLENSPQAVGKEEKGKGRGGAKGRTDFGQLIGITQIVTKEEAMSYVCDDLELLTPSKVEMMTSSLWKDRVEAVGFFLRQVERSDAMASEKGVATAISLLTQLNLFQDSNFQVLRHVYSVVRNLAGRVNFSPQAASLALRGISARITMPKTQKDAMETLTAINRSSRPEIAMGIVLKFLSTVTIDKVVVLMLTWIRNAAVEDGMGNISVEYVAGCCSQLLNNPNPQVKSETINVLTAVKQYVGESPLPYLANTKSVLLERIKKALDSASAAPATHARQDEVAAGHGSKRPATQVSIQGQITPELLVDLESKNWKDRSAAMERLLKILDGTNVRIKDDIGTLLDVLKLRLGDVNKNLITLALQLVARLAQSMKPEGEKKFKGAVMPLIKCLGDKKPNVCAEAVKSLTVLYESYGLGLLAVDLSRAMLENTILRRIIAQWLVRVFGESDDAAIVRVFVEPILRCIQDRTVDVRNHGDTLLAMAIDKIGQDPFRAAIRDVSSSSRIQLEQILNKHAERLEKQQARALDDEERDLSNANGENGQGDPSSSDAASGAAALAGEKIDSAASAGKDFKVFSLDLESIESSAEANAARDGSAVSKDSESAYDIHSIFSNINFGVASSSSRDKFEQLLKSIKRKTNEKLKEDDVSIEETIELLKEFSSSVEVNSEGAIAHVNSMAKLLGEQLGIVLTGERVSIKLAKHVLSTLILIFSRTVFARSVRVNTLQALVHEMISRLIDPRLDVLDSEGGHGLISGLNSVILKVLENSSTSALFVVLLRQLTLSFNDERPAGSQLSFSELAARCLLKLIKPLPIRIDEVDVPTLLMEIQIFLSKEPPTNSVWKTKNAHSLTAVKKLLNELVKIIGPSINSMVEQAELPPDSVTNHFIGLMVNKHHGGTSADGENLDEEGELRQQTEQQQQETIDVEEKLMECLHQISDKETTAEGVRMLYFLQKSHPDILSSSKCANLSVHFRSFLDRQFELLENESKRTDNEKENDVRVSAVRERVPVSTTSVEGDPDQYLLRLRKLRSRLQTLGNE